MPDRTDEGLAHFVLALSLDASSNSLRIGLYGIALVVDVRPPRRILGEGSATFRKAREAWSAVCFIGNELSRGPFIAGLLSGTVT